MGTSALGMAINRNGYPDVVSMLLEYGADPEHRDQPGQTPLMIACRGYVLDAPDREDVLADNETNFHRILNLTHDVNQRDNNGNTALHYVRHPSFLAELCARGSEINVYNQEGKTPLHSYTQEKAELLNTFLRFGSDVNARDVYGKTPLHYVAFNGYDLEKPLKAQLLLAYGASPNLQDDNGQTPVHIATTTVFWEVLRRLIEAGADVNIRDNEGRTPLRIMEDGIVDKGGNTENVYSEESYWDAWWPSSNDVAELLHKAGGHV